MSFVSSFSFRRKKTFQTPTRSKSMRAPKRNYEPLEPEVGFRLILEQHSSNGVGAGTSGGTSNGTNASGASSSSSGNSNRYLAANSRCAVPELSVHLIGARHLPSNFGNKTAEGYVVKVKLFPGTIRFDSSVQTSTWPSFKETFKFSMAPAAKSALRTRHKEVNPYDPLPERVLQGHFLVLTVFGYLELPPENLSSFKDIYISLKRKGSLMLKERPPLLLRSISENEERPVEAKPASVAAAKATPVVVDTKRNIGSVTYFLDPKVFEKNPRNGSYCTEELWLPLKDFSVTPTATSAVTIANSPKGQVEIIMQLCDPEYLVDELSPATEDASPGDTAPATPDFSDKDAGGVLGRRFGSVIKKIKGYRKRKPPKGLCLKITAARLRCALKVKEQFENVSNEIYLKITVFEHDILSEKLKTAMFQPSLSMRLNPDEATLLIPLADDERLDHVSIKVSIAAKSKQSGKKVTLGTLLLDAQETGPKMEQWDMMVMCKGTPAAAWHSFE